jgi:hypothetical protein
VKPGGSFSGSNSGQVIITDKGTGLTFDCSSSSISGKLKSGSGLAGAKIASVTAWSFGSQCVGPGALHYTFTFQGFPYDLNAKSYASGDTTATVTGIAGFMMSNGCDPTIAGTTATTTGQVTADYTNSTHQLVISGGTLHFWHVTSGGICSLFNTGDHITISGTYALTPKQTITSP